LGFKDRIQKLSRTENSIFSVYDKKPKTIDMDLDYHDQKLNMQSELNEDLMEDGFCIV
jgi:hypothetical protein